MLAVAILLAVRLPAQQPAVVGPEQRHGAVASALSALIEREMQDKQVLSMSIALVDGERVVWSRGFGIEKVATRQPATANTVYRVGDLSTLVTTVAVLQRVERGQLLLDVPVQRYVPTFTPRNPFATPITLRMLLSHSSGLIRDPLIGHRSDGTSPTLAATVASLDRTTLLYEPGTAIRHSDAGISIAGLVLERVAGQPFARVMQRDVLTPIGMPSSAFAPAPTLRARMADAQLWTYHERTSPAPIFDLGVSPAAGLYSTAPDLGRLLGVLLNGGLGAGGRLLQRETVDALWRASTTPPTAKHMPGFGFDTARLDAHRLVTIAGGVQGYATHLAALPDERIGVVVLIAKDGMHALSARIAREALRQLLSAKEGTALLPLVSRAALSLAYARRITGDYGSVDSLLRVERHDSTVTVTTSLLPTRLTLRVLSGDTLTADDGVNDGHRLWLNGSALVLDGTVFTRRMPRTTLPDDVPVRWRGLIGEYGPEHDVLYILERDGRLHALVHRLFEYPLTEVTGGVFAFPSPGSHAGERIDFRRDATGRARSLRTAGITLMRRSWIGEDGGVYRITPVKPVAALRAAALATSPPVERGEFLPSALTELVTLDSTIRLDIRYATARNFLSAPMYTQARAFLQRPAADALVRAHRRLAAQGYGLLIHDGYRPWYVTKMFWDGTPTDKHDFVADPASGSRHNRGSAVDLTLYELRTGTPVVMTGGYDEMSDRSYPQYPGGTTRQRALREILRKAMEDEGFSVFAAEWWHFDYKDWRQYRLGNQRFENLSR